MRKVLCVMVVLLLAVLLVPVSFAQSGLAFSTATEATYLNFNNASYVANHTTETLDVFDWGAAKGNSLSIEGHELIGAPTVGWNAYMGGARLMPDISKLMARTNVSPDLFGLYVQGAAGVAGLPSGSKVAFLLGGGAQYRMTPNLAWSTVNVRWLRVGALNGYEISSGLEYYFNPSAAKSLVVQKMLARRATMKLLNR